ncbi:polyketide synthase dehydratase domain-containing protein, partial [Streptomyces chlorus]
TAGELCSPEYWVRQVRDTVRFADTVRALDGRGVTTYLELGPDAVLSAMGADCLENDTDFVPLLRRDKPEPAALVRAVAQAYVRGVPVDWTAFFAGRGARRVDLPTYAFQRQRYWTDARAATGHDLSTKGLDPVDHPFLGASVRLPGTGETVLTGRLSLGTLPWLADHRIGGTVLFPGTGFVELALRAGDAVGAQVLEELTLPAPLVLTEHGAAVRMQVAVGAADEAGTRTVTIHSRPEDAPGAPWTLHAEGVLGPGEHLPTAALDPEPWPPADATPLDLTSVYDRLGALGYHYGPVFQGLRAAWQRGDQLFAEVGLPETAHPDADLFGMHPALLDAALHLLPLDEGRPDGEGPALPFVWNTVRLHASGATVARVRLTSTGPDATSLVMADASGQPVLSMDSLVARSVSADRPAAVVGAVPGPADGRTHRATSATVVADRADAAHTQVARRLVGMGGDSREAAVLDLVRRQVAVTLGHGDWESIEPENVFSDLGFDSLTAVEFRNRMNTVTGLRLPASLAFDHPTARAVAAYVSARVAPVETDPARPVFAAADRLASALSAVPVDFGDGAPITARLEALLRNWRDTHDGAAAAGPEHRDYTTAGDDELFTVLDSELGIGNGDG